MGGCGGREKKREGGKGPQQKMTNPPLVVVHTVVVAYTSAVKDLPDCGGRENVVATQKVGDVAADWYNDRHDEMWQR